MRSSRLLPGLKTTWYPILPNPPNVGITGNNLLVLSGELLVVNLALIVRDGGILVLLVLGDKIVHVGLSLSELPTILLERPSNIINMGILTSRPYPQRYTNARKPYA
jgi:hypothetical protein